MKKTLLPLAILAAAAIAVAAPAVASGPAKSETGHGGSKKDDKKPAVQKISQSESYLGMEPLYTSILEGNRPLGLLMVGIGIDVPDKTLRERVEREMPRLRDGYVRSLMAFTATNVRSWRQPDVAALADRLQGVTDRVLNQKGARVLLAQVAIRLDK